MVKRISVSFSDFCFENYLSETYINRSKYIESLVIKGAESILDTTADNKSKYLKLLQEKNNLDEEIKRLRFENNKRKEAMDNKKSDRERRVAKIKGIMASGVLHND